MDPGLPIFDLVLIGLDSSHSGYTPEDGDPNKIAEAIQELLVSKTVMLREYFSIEISEDGIIQGLPEVLENYIPHLEILPIFLINIATQVEWEKEEECLEGIARKIAEFYAFIPPCDSEGAQAVNHMDNNNNNNNSNNSKDQLPKYPIWFKYAYFFYFFLW